MTDLDQRLQDHLEDLEAGGTLDAITTKLTAEEAELQPLLSLAATLREAPQPRMSPAATKHQRAAIAAIADSAARRRSIFTLGWFAVPVTAVGMAVVFLAFVSLLGGIVIFGRSSSKAVVLSALSGQVERSQAGSVGDWVAVSPGDALEGGDRLRTGDEGGVLLTFYDGSTTALGPQSELVLEASKAGRTGLEVTLSLKRGLTRHAVKKDRKPGAAFTVLTPNASAIAQGTQFEVRVDPEGVSRFSVTEGEIRVEGSDESVTLAAGEASTVFPGRAPSSPAFEFSGQGMVSEIDGSTWFIGGLPVTVTGQTTLIGDPGKGDFVSVIGRLVDGDQWLADQITVSSAELSFFQFAGPVTAIGPDRWIIAGIEFRLDGGTVIDETLTVGSLARVTFLVPADGYLWALAIESLDGGASGSDAVLAFVPERLLGEGCQLAYRFEMDLVNRGEEPVDGIRLVGVIHEGEEFIVSLRLEPMEIETLPNGASVPVEAGLVLNQDWLTPPPGAEIEIWILAVDGSSPSGVPIARAQLVIPARCTRPTPTPTLTATATPTPTLTPQPSPPPGDDKVLVCHIPPGNPDNAHTISIGRSAVPAHLAHGDVLGPCP